MFAAVLADHGRPRPFCLSFSLVSSIRLIQSHKVFLFHFPPFFSNLNAFITILSSFVKGAMFVNDAAVFANNI